MIGMWTCALLALALSPAPRPAITPYQYADGGPPPGAKLSPYVVRLRSAALRKPSRRLNATAIAPARRAARIVRVSLEKELTPSQANDLFIPSPISSTRAAGASFVWPWRSHTPLPTLG